MKVFKKLAAAGAAIMMAVTGMAVNVSATVVSYWQTYNLYMYTGMPSGYQNVTSVTIGDYGSNQVFATDTKNYVKIENHKISMSAESVYVYGQVYSNETWKNAGSFPHYSFEPTNKTLGYIYIASTPTQSAVKTTISLNYTAPNQSAYCQIIAH